jgi:hypothetical protein
VTERQNKFEVCLASEQRVYTTTKHSIKLNEEVELKDEEEGEGRKSKLDDGIARQSEEGMQ